MRSGGISSNHGAMVSQFNLTFRSQPIDDTSLCYRELFPLVVIFIGVENMFNIVDAVMKTSITLPVKERVAEGLGKAGTSNTLKVVSYNSVLGVIAFFSTGAIRQFCAFSIVVLVAHWFLVHTFFVTVVSIDIQRLEVRGCSHLPRVV